MQETETDKKRQIAEVFGRAAATYDRVGSRPFSYFGPRLVAAAGLARGARVLDVAAGRGALLFAAAEQVGPEGHVTAIDLSAPMVEATAAEIERCGLKNARIRLMDPEQLEFEPASFDAVLCGFGLMFLPHLDRALAGFRRVLRPGGTLAVSTWAGQDPRWTWYQELQRAYGVQEPLMTQRLRPPDLEAALGRAGFEGVNVWTDEAELLCADEADWWTENWSHGVRATLELLRPAELERFKAEALDGLRAVRTPYCIPRRWLAVFGLGRNP